MNQKFWPRFIARMRDRTIHIVSFDVPYPADYGGAIDVFYRITALHKLGVKIILHCFEYGRGKQNELEKYAQEVHYYKRKRSFVDWVSTIPFIVKTRASKELIQNLCKDNHPILFEGLHSTYYLSDERLKGRLKFVRTHNIEHQYYGELAKNSHGFKKRFLSSEAKKLKRFEPILKAANHILAIKESDKNYFSAFHTSVHILTASMPEFSVQEQKSTEPYCLFHGNLSVVENEMGANWLIDHVFRPLQWTVKLKIAGKNPSAALQAKCEKLGVELRANPTQAEMETLIANARIHIFHSDQATGVKLKLINALNSSGHVIVNDKMIEGTHLDPLCSLAKSIDGFKALVKDKIESELSITSFEERRSYLKNQLNTVENCKLITELLCY